MGKSLSRKLYNDFLYRVTPVVTLTFDRIERHTSRMLDFPLDAVSHRMDDFLDFLRCSGLYGDIDEKDEPIHLARAFLASDIRNADFFHIPDCIIHQRLNDTVRKRELPVIAENRPYHRPFFILAETLRHFLLPVAEETERIDEVPLK